MSDHRYLVKRSDGTYYRRGQAGVTRWVSKAAQACPFVLYESANETAKRETALQGNSCIVVRESAEIGQPGFPIQRFGEHKSDKI